MIFQTLFFIILAFITPLLLTLSFLIVLSILTTPQPLKLLCTSTISLPPTPFLCITSPMASPLVQCLLFKNLLSSKIILQLTVFLSWWGNTSLPRHISEPFSLSETECILHSPIYCSPFIVDEQDQGPGVPPKYCVCCNLSKDDPILGMGSINSFISKEDFPTCFNMACHVAEAVSYSSVSSCFSWFYYLLTVLSCHIDILLPCHLDNLLLCQLDILFSCQLDILFSCQLDILLLHHLDVLFLSTWHLILMSTWHFTPASFWCLIPVILTLYFHVISMWFSYVILTMFSLLPLMCFPFTLSTSIFYILLTHLCCPSRWLTLHLAHRQWHSTSNLSIVLVLFFLITNHGLWFASGENFTLIMYILSVLA